MRALLHWPCSLPSLGTALVVLAGFLLAPAPARAGCGEHIVVIAAVEKTEPISAPAPPAMPAKKHAPCSGPHCSRSPLAPTPPPAVPVGPSGPDWACLLEQRLPSANPSVRYFSDDPLEHSLFVGSSVYHPPR